MKIKKIITYSCLEFALSNTYLKVIIQYLEPKIFNEKRIYKIKNIKP